MRDPIELQTLLTLGPVSCEGQTLSLGLQLQMSLLMPHQDEQLPEQIEAVVHQTGLEVQRRLFQSYILAPARYGRHDDPGLRESFGHSMIVDPWGHAIAMASDGPGLALAEIDLERVARIRRSIPVGQHFCPGL